MGYLDATKNQPQGHTVTGLSVDGLPITIEPGNTQSAQLLGDVRLVTAHWSVGTYGMCFDDYHFCVVFDTRSRKAHVVKTLRIAQMGQHAFKYNSHNIGIGFMAMFKTDPRTGAGAYPITPEMLEVGAKFTAEFMAWHRLDDLDHQLMDHYMVDRLPQVARGEKVDIRLYWDAYLAKVKAHYAALKAGTEQFSYRALLVDA